VPRLFIDGQWVASGDGTCSQVINPSDGTVVTEVDVATDEQVQAAIAAARRAFDTTDWPRTPTGERAALLDRVADLLDRDLEDLATEETRNTGKAMRESRWDIGDVARVFRYYAQLADKEAGRLVDASNPDAISRIVYEPVGVCALIAPWNYPLLQLSWKVAPALAAGNTAVMKPAQVTPLTAIHLTRLLEEAGTPTTYGLAGAVWTADASRAQRVAGRLRHGTVWINDYNTYLPQAEWGGFKQSGIGRELGPSGLDEYREAKHIWQNTAPGPTGWFGGSQRGVTTA